MSLVPKCPSNAEARVSLSNVSVCVPADRAPGVGFGRKGLRSGPRPSFHRLHWSYFLPCTGPVRPLRRQHGGIGPHRERNGVR